MDIIKTTESFLGYGVRTDFGYSTLINYELGFYITVDSVEVSNYTIDNINFLIKFDTAPSGNIVITGTNYSTEFKGDIVNVSNNYNLDVSAGKIKGRKTIHKFGRNPDITIAEGFETLWNGGGFYTGFDATVGELVNVSSSDANDNITGTGSRIVTLFGLDENWEEITEDIELNGTINVLSTKLFIRCDTITTIDSGSNQFNLGVISVIQSTSGIVFARVPIGYNSTMIAAYTIPAGKTGYLDTLFSSSGGGRKAFFSIVRFVVRPFGQVFSVASEAELITNGASSLSRDFKYPIVLTEKTDIHIMADTSEDNIGVAGAFDLILVDN